MIRAYVTSVLLLGALLTVSCDDRQPLAPSRAPALARADRVQEVGGILEVRGMTGEGAMYGLFVPSEGWNHSLVVYAHGFVSSDAPVTLEPGNTAQLRAALNALGYAVAYSSYSDNGWIVSDGATRTHQLPGLFTAFFQRPTRVYLAGSSMGSLVALKLVEMHPEQYDGVLLRAGFLGGAQTFMDHLYNVRLLFNLYYPGVLPGRVTDLPVLGNTQLLALAQTAMLANPTGAARIGEAMAAIRLPLPVVPGRETATLVSSILTALGQFNGGARGILALTHGRIPFDNTATDYVIPEVQAGIERIDGDRDALNYMQQNYQPRGRLTVPAIALDAAWDPVAPMFHKDRYARLLSETGASNLLYRIVLPEYGHGPQSLSATVSALEQLARWVETGVRP